MPSRITDILAALAATEDGGRPLYDVFAEIFTALDARLAVVEGVSGSLAAVEAQLGAAGQALVEAALDPVRAAIADKADLGAVLTATSVSTVAVGTGPKTIVVAPEAARAAFAPAHILSIVASDDPTRAMYARRVSYDAASGELVVDVLAAIGSGTYTSWTIAPASLASMAAAVSCIAEGEIAGPTVQAAIGQIAAALAARQGSHANLSALAGLALAAERMLVTTPEGGLDQSAITTAARTFLALGSTDAMRSALGAAPLLSPAFTGAPTVPTPSITTDSNLIVNVSALRQAVAALVASSPAALDTLAELAAALGNNANYATTVTNALAGKQPLDATLTALAALVTAADKLIYSTGADAFATTPLTAFARSLLDDVDAAAMRATLAVPFAGASPGLTDSGYPADFNQDLPSGWYTVSGTMDNGPSGTGSYVGTMIVVQRSSQSRRSQQMLLLGGETWVRFGYNLSTTPVWSTWQRLITTADLVGGALNIATTGAVVAGRATAGAEVGFTPKLQVHGTSTEASALITAWRGSSSGANLAIAKSRGITPGSVGAVVNGDILGDVSFYGDDGTDLSSRAAVIRGQVDGVPATGVVPGRLLFYCATAAGVITERMRIDSAGNIQVNGPYTVIAADRHIQLRSYTVATLPSATTATQMIYVSNGTSNKRLAVSDGTNWRWPDGAIVS